MANAKRIEAVQQSAQDFEATFIAQMLTFSGLDKALTLGGGSEMGPFASFYIEALAEDMAQQGGLGLAADFYDTLIKQDTP